MNMLLSILRFCLVVFPNCFLCNENINLLKIKMTDWYKRNKRIIAVMSFGLLISMSIFFIKYYVNIDKKIEEEARKNQIENAINSIKAKYHIERFSIEELLSNDSGEFIILRKKIANVLSKKKCYFCNTLGFSALNYMGSFLSLDKIFNTEKLSEYQKEKGIQLFGSFPIKLQEEVMKIINKEVFNKDI